ncbi:MAG TPA: bifunctional phosphopantothenoylcysteine decarboxylase/phosphopantothenate--cysteine ligase CoaBC [Chloroflexota bacterium]|nr:bifunctional phosphopantothenoylcysteine decarboxylase/phosphopantothenate--cysteine ligase CoaBC [Chloroflexota bacterium]
METMGTVVVGVGGGIAAYKALEVTSKLVQLNLDVRVVLSANAARFVTPLSFESLSHHPVLSDLWAEQPDLNISHVRLGSMASVLAIVPATANLLAQLAYGLAADALTATALACPAPLILAPAMNSRMWDHPATRDNLRLLVDRGAEVIGPETGYLAEGTSGIGRLAPPELIVEAILRALRRRSDLAGQTIIVSAGPTREAIDPVRYISNRSSGKMGYALAEAARDRGARVILVSGPVSLTPPAGIQIVRVTTAQEMLDRIQDVVEPHATLIMAAAVADYAPAEPAAHKLKRSSSGTTLSLTPTPDILRSLRRPTGLRVVAFAAETRDLLTHANAKLLAKGAEMLVANDVSEEGAGFDSDSNHVWFLKRNQPPIEVPRAAKRTIADQVLDALFRPASARAAKDDPGV